MASNWQIQVSITRGTIGSRDFGVETTKFNSVEPLQSLEDCLATAEQLQTHYARMGYSMSFRVIVPDGAPTSK